MSISLILVTLAIFLALLISSPKPEPCQYAANAMVVANAETVRVPDWGKIGSIAYHRRDNTA